METKTVLALTDEVFAAAEVLAHRLGLSRSALYARAVTAFVEGHRRGGLATGGWDDARARPSTTSTGGSAAWPAAEAPGESPGLAGCHGRVTVR